jgi:RNA polymerase sigma-70 factor (ECF subfamily)
MDTLDRLFEEVGGLLLSMAKKYLVDKSLAEDLTSEILARLSKRAGRFDVKKNGLNWLYKSVRNEAINRNKKTGKIRCDNIDDHRDLADVITPLDNSIDSIMLRDALKKLPTAESQVLYYKFWEGLTVRDIAAILKKPRSTVQNLIDKALKNVGGLLDK